MNQIEAIEAEFADEDPKCETRDCRECELRGKTDACYFDE